LLKAASAAALLLAAALGAAPLAAQVLYKWVDDQGKTQYSDKPPKKFKGELTRIETEVDKTTLPPSTAPASPAPPAGGAATRAAPTPAGEDIAAKRRATRARLGDQLAKARAKVESAKKALAQAETPEVDERQVVQQRAATGGMHGMAPRSNCRWEGAGNQKWLMCPTAVPSTEYHDRVARLEEDLRKAEEELAAAEQAWRRGVD
jgi:hypothetical protein